MLQPLAVPHALPSGLAAPELPTYARRLSGWHCLVPFLALGSNLPFQSDDCRHAGGKLGRAAAAGGAARAAERRGGA